MSALGVAEDSESLPTEEFMRVAPGVWAVGDVTGQGASTHLATYQAAIAVADMSNSRGHAAESRAVPRVVFTDPEIGSVGLTEGEARCQGLTLWIGRAPLSVEARGWIQGVGKEGLIKLIEDHDRGVLVGALSVSPSGGEVLALLTLVIHADVPTRTLRSMLFAYPTFHRAVEAALTDLHATTPS